MIAQEPKLTVYMCQTCGTQFPPAAHPPQICPICQDDRQYVKRQSGSSGPRWSASRLTNRNLDPLRGAGADRHRHRPALRHRPASLSDLCTPPLRSTSCGTASPLLDEAVVEMVKVLGGVSAIAISHPHYYSSMVEWSRAFGGVPVYLHVADSRWVMRLDKAIVSWEGETNTLVEGLTLVRCGGHFEGGTVLHWPAGAEGRGVLLTGDIINVVQDRRFVSFMYSFPNLIPLSPNAVRRVVAAVEPFAYDRIYSAWWDKVTYQDAKQAVHRSAERYIALIEQDEPVNHPAAVR